MIKELFLESGRNETWRNIIMLSNHDQAFLTYIGKRAVDNNFDVDMLDKLLKRSYLFQCLKSESERLLEDGVYTYYREGDKGISHTHLNDTHFKKYCTTVTKQYITPNKLYLFYPVFDDFAKYYLKAFAVNDGRNNVELVRTVRYGCERRIVNQELILDLEKRY